MADEHVPVGERYGGDLWAPLMRAVECEARGETISEELADDVREAAMTLAAAALSRGGIDLVDIEAMLVLRDWSTHLSYDTATERLTVALEFDDGERLDLVSVPDGVEHVGHEERWVSELPTAGGDLEGYEYVRWVCSCGEVSQPFIDKGDECEADFHRHAAPGEETPDPAGASTPTPDNGSTE